MDRAGATFFVFFRRMGENASLQDLVTLAKTRGPRQMESVIACERQFLEAKALYCLIGV